MITSRQNQLIKLIRSLKDKKYRDAEGLYVVEGVKLVREAYGLGLNIHSVICTEKGYDAIKDVPELCATAQLVADEVFNSASGEVSPQGVLAVLVKPTFAIAAPQGCSLYLDGVSDPSNVGMIIRTAAAAGYNDIYLANCADPFSPKAVRASMGGIFRIRTHVGKEDELLKAVDCPIVVADMGGVNVFDGKIDGKFCLVIGNEGHGVSTNLRARATYTVSIPMQNDMESLNAGVSAAILMYTLKN